MAGDELKITCGTVKSPCKNVEDYPECDPPKPVDGWIGVAHLLVCQPEGKDAFVNMVDVNGGEFKKEDCPNARAPIYMDNPATEEVEHSELDVIINGTTLTDEKKVGVCRSHFLGTSGDYYKWYAYEAQLGYGAYLALYNFQSKTMIKDAAGYELHPSEVMALYNCEELHLTDDDLSMKDGFGPPVIGKTDKGEDIYGRARYYFTKQPERLSNEAGTGLIDILEDKNVKIPGMTKKSREALIKHLRIVYRGATIQETFLKRSGEVQEEQSMMMKMNIAMMGVFIFIVGQPFFKEMYKRFRGSFRVTRYDKYIDRMLQTHPDYAIKGRDDVIRTSLRMMSKRVGYPSILLDAPTGEGKDVIVEGIVIEKQKANGRFPARFRDAPVYKINAAEFQSGTMYRGTVADKVAEISRRARKGPVIYYISEIDLVFLSGGTTSGDTESPGKLILDLVDDETIKRNLIIVGTTSRGGKMLAKYPDLQRRFNWPTVDKFSLKESVEVIDGPYIDKVSKDYDGIKIDRGIIEASAKLGEALYRPHLLKGSKQVIPRFAAITAMIETASQIAIEEAEADGLVNPQARKESRLARVLRFLKRSGPKEQPKALPAENVVVTIDHVLRAAAELLGEPVKQADQERLLDKMSLEEVELETAPKLGGAQVEGNAAFDSFAEELNRLRETGGYDLTLREAVEVAKVTYTDAAISPFGFEVQEDVVEAAAKLGELHHHEFRNVPLLEGTKAEWTHVVLDKAAELADAEGVAPEVRHVVEATGVLCEKSLQTEIFLDKAIEFEHVEVIASKFRSALEAEAGVPESSQSSAEAAPFDIDKESKGNAVAKEVMRAMIKEGYSTEDPGLFKEHAEALAIELRAMDRGMVGEYIDTATGRFHEGGAEKLSDAIAEKVGGLDFKPVKGAQKKADEKKADEKKADEKKGEHDAKGAEKGEGAKGKGKGNGGSHGSTPVK